MYWKVPRIWANGDVWIIGGGTSFPKQFGVPVDVIAEVEAARAPITVYSEYLKPLHDKNVIGVNLAFLLGNWISALYFCDRQFFRAYHKTINKFPNLKVTDVQGLGSRLEEQGIGKNIKRLQRDEAFGLSIKPHQIKWNGNSGAAAINFATLAGAKRVLLLGFDMRPMESVVNGKRTHWHQGHPLYKTPTDNHTYKRFLRAFPAIAHDAKKQGVEILNVSPKSNITQFKKVALEDVL